MAVRKDRKELIIDQAVSIFAEKGYYKATTALVAAAAGVTQPYVFHFFKSKEELFKAVIDRAINKIYDTFTQIEAPGDSLMKSMADAFMQLMQAHRDEIVMVLNAHAITEPAIREHVREKFCVLHETIMIKFEQAGMPNAHEAACKFFATGHIITVSEVLDLPQLLWFKTE